MRKHRLLIFIVAYDAEATIVDVLRRIPATLASDYDVEILVIDGVQPPVAALIDSIVETAPQQ